MIARVFQYVLVLTLARVSLLEAQGWSQLPTTNDPPARRNASAIYDPVNHRVVLFGGRGSGGDLNDLWSLNLSTNVWQQITATGNTPATRHTADAMYDSASHRMIIWSGQGATLFNDVWAFDLNTDAWQQLSANGNEEGVPNIRYGTASVFDPLKRRLVNFAGFTSAGRFDDTWYFHIDSLTWNDRTTEFHPLKRCLHSAAFAPNERRMLIYAGQSTGFLDDLWSLDLESFTWTAITPSAKPTGRYFSPIVYDGIGNILMFAGQTAQGPSDELWYFSLTTNLWNSIPHGTTWPAARYGHIMLLTSESTFVVFGGSGASLLNDTWVYSPPSTGMHDQSSLPELFALRQNFPNPFNPSTTILFSLPTEGYTTLTVFDLWGREVETLFDRSAQPGEYRVEFNPANLGAGVYYARLRSGSFVATRKMVYLK